RCYRYDFLYNVERGLRLALWVAAYYDKLKDHPNLLLYNTVAADLGKQQADHAALAPRPPAVWAAAFGASRSRINCPRCRRRTALAGSAIVSSTPILSSNRGNATASGRSGRSR